MIRRPTPADHLCSKGCCLGAISTVWQRLAGCRETATSSAGPAANYYGAEQQAQAELQGDATLEATERKGGDDEPRKLKGADPDEFRALMNTEHIHPLRRRRDEWRSVDRRSRSAPQHQGHRKA